MRVAAAGGAQLVQFPEGMLSGYAKNPIQDWADTALNKARPWRAAASAGDIYTTLPRDRMTLLRPSRACTRRLFERDGVWPWSPLLQ